MPKKRAIDKIISATLNLIQKNGYAATNTNKIAKLSNVSVGTLYYHFPQGKVSILKYIFKKNMDLIVKQGLFSYPELNDIKKRDITKLLREFLKSHIQQHRKMKPLLIALTIEFLTTEGFYNSLKSNMEEELNQFKILMKKILNLDSISPPIDKKIMKISYMIDFIIHDHIFFDDVLGTEEDLVEILLILIKSMINEYFYIQFK